jgi:lysophospholipase L1-like esterase
MSPAKRLRDLGLNLLVMVASLVVFFGLAEGLARLGGYTPYPAQADVFRQQFERDQFDANRMFIFDPSRVWDLRPGFVGYDARTEDYGRETISINSQGRRDTPVSLNKPAGTYRIALLGDSVAFGLKVEAKDNFATQIEWNLNARSSSLHYEVLNFGVPGYGTWQEISMLKEKALAYDPDLVILAFGMNDLTDNRRADRSGSLDMMRAQGVAKFLRERSAFYRFLREKILSVEANIAQRDPCTGLDLTSCWQMTEQLLDQVVDATRTRQRNVKFVLVVFPIRAQTLRPALSTRQSYQEVLAKYAREKGIPEIDLLNAFVQNSSEGLFLDESHPTEIGHSIAAIEILEQLDAQGVLPPP